MPRHLLLCICALAASACHGETAPPARLLDGTDVRRPPVTLAGVGGTVVQTRVRVVADAARSTSPAVASCHRQGTSARASAPAVVRVGVTGRSVAFRTSNGRGIVACDGVWEHGRAGRWCGRAYGRLRRGRLPDPRLDLACTDATGKGIGFAWIEPDRRARYVVVRQHGHSESYEVAAGLPVRVSTSAVDIGRSSARFDLSQHDAHGRLIRRRLLRAEVSG